MSFDDLIGLFIFLLFVGVPLVNRLRRSRRGPGPQPQRRPQRPPQTTIPQPASPPATVQGESESDDPITRRLEEARRRVEAARRSTAGGQTAPQPSRPPAVPPPAAPPPAIPRLGRPAGPIPEPFMPRFVPPPAAAPPAARTAMVQTQPLEVVRKRARARARIDKAAKRHSGVLKFGSDDIVRGILWHQILSEPVAFEHLKRRRTPSQLRSP